MLVLERKSEEVIIIGEDIEIKIIAIRGEKVRLGVTAPEGISIHRKEVYDAIKKQESAG